MRCRLGGNYQWWIIMALFLAMLLGFDFAQARLSAKKNMAKPLVAYDFEGEKFAIESPLPKIRCKKAFIYEQRVQEWIRKCEKVGGQLIYPDVCSPRVWCTKNVGNESAEKH